MFISVRKYKPKFHFYGDDKGNITWCVLRLKIKTLQMFETL